jgi:predicted phosphodiesterase
MKLAVISDIHGNAVALEATLRDLDCVAPDKVVCLGDAIQGGPQPAECVAMLRDRGWQVVMGNADAWLLSGVDTGNEMEDDKRRRELYDVREWSLSKLSAEDKEYIETFQPHFTVDLTPDAELLCFHGSPTSFDKILLPLTPDEEFAKFFQVYEQRMMCGGHTHVQYVRHFKRRMFFNPGSVGFAYRHGQAPERFRADPWSEYAVLTVTDSTSSLEFRRVAFDGAALRSIYASSGRPHADAAIAQYS